MIELYWFYNRDFDLLFDSIENSDGKIKLKCPGKSAYNNSSTLLKNN